jgi:uncharacterized protein YbgA (DUF1722 family)/uncharacterized protein YbbK (DUF523 family)
MKEKFSAKPKLGISSCLLGNKVRFDGGHKRDLFLTQGLGEFIEWVIVCPEFEVGMGVPREAVRLVGRPEAPEMIAEKSGRNWTATMNQFAAQRAHQFSKLNLSGFVFKKNSPSCGMERVKIFNPKGPPSRQGRGLFAAALMEELPFMPCEEEGRLSDPKLRENFIERVFAYHRWCGAIGEKHSISGLVEFHTKHKFLLLAHSETHYRRLGRVVAAAKQKPLGEVYREYGALFMQALALHASAKKHANVLDHMLGYFSKQLCADEREEIVALIGDFRRGLVPLIVPITLVRHYAKKYQVQYLLEQIYLDPSPKELMLRNHV